MIKMNVNTLKVCSRKGPRNGIMGMEKGKTMSSYARKGEIKFVLKEIDQICLQIVFF